MGTTHSTILSKTIVAVTGLFMVLFLAAHLTGNLIVYAGADAFNAYGAFMKGISKLLWLMRIGLIISVILHIYHTLKLAGINKAAKPVGYAVTKYQRTKFSSRSMLLAGITILAFVIYHLLHFTLGVAQPEFYSGIDNLGRHDIYYMLVMGFKNPIISGFYIVAMIGVGLHLHHGVRSMFQTLGLTGPELDKKLESLSLGVAVLLTLGFISIPLAVLMGIVGSGI